MAQYRKKPVVIEAVQWDGTNVADIREHFGDFLEWTLKPFKDEIHIFTLEGIMCASKGDWVIKGIKGEFYTCNPDIFANLYDPA